MTNVINEQTIPENPLTADNTKAALLAALVSDPALLKEVGAAWFLYLRLVLVEDGKMIGTYEEIGLAIGVVGKTVRNWAAALETASIVKCEPKGHRVSLELVGKHLEAAKAPTLVQTGEAVAAAAAPMSPRVERALKIIKAAVEGDGQIELKAVL